MGIDVYLYWDGMSNRDYWQQIQGFSTVIGRFGYLREAYHGEPYATQILVSEDWDDQKQCAWCKKNPGKGKSKAAWDTYFKRFTDAMDSLGLRGDLAHEMAFEVYNAMDRQNCKCGFVIPNAELRKRLPAAIQASIARQKELYHEEVDENSDVIRSYTDFVDLHGRLEKEGKHPRILVSA